MGNDFGLTKPPGDPDTLTTVAGNLTKIAGDMHGHGGAITTEAGGMATAWPPPSGTPATNEAKTLGGIVQDYGGHINSGATALKTYATALHDAQTNIVTLQGKAQTADTNALADARKKNPGQSDDQLRTTGDYSTPFEADMGPLRTQYGHEISTLKTAATTCQGALQNTIPGYKKGMSAADAMAVTMNNVLLKLPSAAAEQAKEDAQVFQYQLQHGFKGNDPYSKAMYERIAAESNNQAYADAFANQLKADGLISVPEALEQTIKYGGLSDGQRSSLMTAMSNIIGQATDTRNNPNHLADGEIQKLVHYASDTDLVDAGRDGGNWRRSWAMAELLGYSKNWSPQFLSDVSSEIYDNRGKLRNLQQASDELPISSNDNGFVHTDPMLIALQKLGDNSQAGRLFFDVKDHGQPTRILDLMREYSQAAPTAVGNSESILTNAIKQAAIDFPPGGRTGPDGQRGADIASWFMHYAADEARGQAGFTDTLYPPTQHAITSILSAYYGDVARTLRDGSGFDPGQGAYMVTNDPLFNGQFGANLSYGDASLLLSNVMHDDGMRQTLYQAAGTYTNANLQIVAAQHGDLGNAYFQYGADLKRLLSAANLVDAQNAQQSKELLSIVKIGSGVAGVFMPGEDAVGAIAANGLKTLKAVADGSLANFVDPVGSQSKDYAARLSESTNGADNVLITSALHYHLDNDPSLDPSHNAGLSWTDDQGHQHSFYDPKNNEIDPPPQSSGDYDKFTKWYDDVLGSGQLQNYRQNFDNGFDHPPSAGG